MKWLILVLFVLIFLPFYAYVLSKCVEMGKIVVRKQLNNNGGSHDKTDEEDQQV